MQYLISLPAGAVTSFHALSSLSPDECFAGSDPVGAKVGSGGGTAWLLREAWKQAAGRESLCKWLARERRILIHGGGQGRRLPAYAPVGKLLLPMPVLRWERGQRLDQTLLDVQRPTLERIFGAAPAVSNTMIASGDALVLFGGRLPELPSVDVLCVGLSVEPSLACRHGVFVCSRETPQTLDYMVQKPSTDTLKALAGSRLFSIDVGIWMLSDRAMALLMERCGWNEERQEFAGGQPPFYDLYGNFGLGLGSKPAKVDPELASLTVAIVHLPQGEFHHWGTSSELISSSWALQNKVQDQQSIWARNVKPHPAMFVQNSRVDVRLTDEHANTWIENTHVAEGWELGGNQVITGVPLNDWRLSLPSGVCLDVVPIGKDGYALRPYGVDDPFRGPVDASNTTWLGQPLGAWLFARGLEPEQSGLLPGMDIQDAPLFPLLSESDHASGLLQWMIDARGDYARRWQGRERLSASQISESANLLRLASQRREFRAGNWQQLANNQSLSVFFQVDLAHAAEEFANNNLEVPDSLTANPDPLRRTHAWMLRSRVERLVGKGGEAERRNAFESLERTILEPIRQQKVTPIWNVYEDQIVWARSPVRIDIAGGWTDTPPYCVLEGGDVVNFALELNGQPPLQAFVRPRSTRSIVLRSIDLGESLEISSYEELSDYARVGSAFSIPKAALCLAGFSGEFCSRTFSSLSAQLEEFGCGFEVSFVAAIPKGSGMGTSSILAATVLGALSDFCRLGWDSHEICNRTLALEQLLTTGGGWQDQYGGITPGAKLLQTERGWNQTPRVRWLPEYLFTNPDCRASMMLYYTGITRVAKRLLADVVEGMFLNERDRLLVLKEMKQHARDTFEAMQQCDYAAYAGCVARSWFLNKQLDPGTSTAELELMLAPVADFTLGYKLPGAGGGGYLLLLAKDQEAGRRIRAHLTEHPPNRRARFVEMSLSGTGLQVSRS